MYFTYLGRSPHLTDFLQNLYSSCRPRRVTCANVWSEIFRGYDFTRVGLPIFLLILRCDGMWKSIHFVVSRKENILVTLFIPPLRILSLLWLCLLLCIRLQISQPALYRSAWNFSWRLERISDRSSPSLVWIAPGMAELWASTAAIWRDMLLAEALVSVNGLSRPLWNWCMFRFADLEMCFRLRVVCWKVIHCVCTKEWSSVLKTRTTTYPPGTAHRGGRVVGGLTTAIVATWTASTERVKPLVGAL